MTLVYSESLGSAETKLLLTRTNETKPRPPVLFLLPMNMLSNIKHIFQFIGFCNSISANFNQAILHMHICRV